MIDSDTRPLIVTAGLGEPVQGWATGLRRAYFPPERNYLAAHLTLFHALPPSLLDEVKTRLADHARRAPPKAWINGLMNLGRGVALSIESEELDRIRRELQHDFHGSLSAQDAGGWRPHVTIQNKVEPSIAKATLGKLTREGVGDPRPLTIAALELHRYDGGPWEPVKRFPFRG